MGQPCSQRAKMLIRRQKTLLIFQVLVAVCWVYWGSGWAPFSSSQRVASFSLQRAEGNSQARQSKNKEGHLCASEALGALDDDCRVYRQLVTQYELTCMKRRLLEAQFAVLSAKHQLTSLNQKIQQAQLAAAYPLCIWGGQYGGSDGQAVAANFVGFPVKLQQASAAALAIAKSPTATSNTELSLKPSNNTAYSEDERQLLSSAPTTYMIQLMGAYDQHVLDHFIRAQALGKQAKQLYVQSHGKRWYVLLYGYYPSHRAAKAALQALPASWKQHHPWIRYMADLQSDIKNRRHKARS